MNANINQFQNPSVRAKRGGRRAAIKARVLQWLIKDMALTNLKVGNNTITMSPGGVDVIRWSATQASAALGDLAMNNTTGRPSGFIGGSDQSLSTLAETIHENGDNPFTADQSMGSNKLTNVATPTATGDVANKAYVDSIATGLQWVSPVVCDVFIGSASIVEINALTPVAGDCVVAEDAGTPTAGTSDALVAGSVAEFDGTSWQQILAGSGGFVVANTRLLVSTTTGFTVGGGLTASTDEGKVAVFDGTSLTPTSFVTSVDGDAALIKGETAVNENKAFTFDGIVPTGTWVQFAGSGGDHGALSGLLDDDHTQYVFGVGRALGQSVIGGTGAAEDLTLESTSNASKGNVVLASGTDFELAGSDQIRPATDNTGNLGTAALRFAEIHGVQVVSGDHIFRDKENGWNYVVKEGPRGLEMFNEDTGAFMGEIVVRKGIRRRIAHSLGL